jgi:RNA polymerase sigma-70 factor (ECF subfamily)
LAIVAQFSGELEADHLQLYAAIRALTLAQRALVVLYLDGFTYREISEVVGISESNVGVRLNRIKRELAAAVKEPGNES